jgi:hypothetical protein
MRSHELRSVGDPSRTIATASDQQGPSIASTCTAFSALATALAFCGEATAAPR